MNLETLVKEFYNLLVNLRNEKAKEKALIHCENGVWKYSGVITEKREMCAIGAIAPLEHFHVQVHQEDIPFFSARELGELLFSGPIEEIGVPMRLRMESWINRWDEIVSIGQSYKGEEALRKIDQLDNSSPDLPKWWGIRPQLKKLIAFVEKGDIYSIAEKKIDYAEPLRTKYFQQMDNLLKKEEMYFAWKYVRPNGDPHYLPYAVAMGFAKADGELTEIGRFFKNI